MNGISYPARVPRAIATPIPVNEADPEAMQPLDSGRSSLPWQEVR